MKRKADGRLVLARQYGEGVYILCEGTEPIYIQVAQLRRDNVRIAFQASDRYRVIREELVRTCLTDKQISDLTKGCPVTRDIIDKFRHIGR